MVSKSATINHLIFNIILSERALSSSFFCLNVYEDVLQELFYFIDTEEERKTLQEFRRVKEYFYYIDADEERVTGVLFVVKGVNPLTRVTSLP